MCLIPTPLSCLVPLGSDGTHQMPLESIPRGLPQAKCSDTILGTTFGLILMLLNREFTLFILFRLDKIHIQRIPCVILSVSTNQGQLISGPCIVLHVLKARQKIQSSTDPMNVRISEQFFAGADWGG